MSNFEEFNFRARYKKSPLLSNFSSILPDNIADLFKWMEFIATNNSVASAGIKKLSEVPVTSFRYYTSGDQNEASFSTDGGWKDILEDDMNLKSRILSISYNTLLYGNCFVSIYTPFNRRLTCKCGSTVSAFDAEDLTVELKDRHRDGEASVDKKKQSNDVADKYYTKTNEESRLIFKCYCKSCRKITRRVVTDDKLKSPKKINIISWDPSTIKISSNPISGDNIYYYFIPDNIRSRIKKNDPQMLSTLHPAMIEASLSNKQFKFADGKIYHSRRENIDGISTAWGMPALLSAMPSFLSLMILRKANEKIATDYMVPLRALYPSQTQSGAGEIYNFMGGGDFTGKVNSMLKKWKMDPSAVQTIPFPLGVETILGDGKMLTLNNEIDQLESNIANTLGIPIEFIKGGLSYSSQGSSLRLLENQMARLTANLEDVIDFIVDQVANSLGKDPIKVKMVPFKIVDDLQEKAAIIQMAQSGSGVVSNATIMEMFNIDSGSEQSRIDDEQKSNIKKQLDMQNYQKEVANDIEERAKAQEQMNTSQFSELNQQKLMMEAQQKAEELLQMDDGMRKSQLDEMSKNNFIMYGAVKAVMEMMRGKQEYQQQQQG